MDGSINASLHHRNHECELSWLNLSNNWVQTIVLWHGYGQEQCQSDLDFHLIYVIDYMRRRFVRTLSVTICDFSAINDFSRIDAYRARIVSVILRIVSDFSRIVRPKLADTNCGRSLSHWRPFLVSQWADWYFWESCAQMVITVNTLTFRQNCPTSQTGIYVRALTFGHNCPFAQWLLTMRETAYYDNNLSTNAHTDIYSTENARKILEGKPALAIPMRALKCTWITVQKQARLHGTSVPMVRKHSITLRALILYLDPSLQT